MKRQNIQNYIKEKNFFYFFLFNFFLHLISINFFPTNFEGTFSEYGNFFNQDDKVKYVLNYYSGQFNTFIFSLLISMLYFVFPFFDTLHYAHFLSALSYFFWIYGMKNFLNFFKIDKVIIFLIILNPLIFYYGFRIYSDFLAFSLAFYAISGILNNKKNYLYLFLYSISILLKPQNLIFIFIFYFLFFNKLTIKNLITYNIYLILPFFFLIFTNYKFFNFFLVPNINSNDVAIKGFAEMLSNFIFYIGYLGIICFPIGLSYLSINYKKKFFILILLFSFFIGLFLSLFMSAFDSELSIGVFKNFIHPKFYDFAICFVAILTLSMIFDQIIKKNELKYLVIVFHIFCYMLILSFIKISPKYLIIVVPFYYILFSDIVIRKIYSNFLSLLAGIIITFLLLFNYYQVGYSAEKIFQFLNEKKIFHMTRIDPIVPHIYHLVNMDFFQDEYHIKGKPILSNLGEKIIYEVVYANQYNLEQNTHYVDNRKMFGFEINKFKIIKINE